LTALRKNTFTELPRFFAESPVYGPFNSRRYGPSLGINLSSLKEKACSMNCVFCEAGPTNIRLKEMKASSLPTPENIVEKLRIKIEHSLRTEKVQLPIHFSGAGEPTLHPYFDEIVDAVINLRNTVTPDSPIRVFTNGTFFDQRKVISSLNRVDERIVKVDCGRDSTMKSLNRPLKRFTTAKLSSGCRLLKNCITQSLFVKGPASNLSDDEIELWIELIGIIKPLYSQIYSIERQPSEPFVVEATEDELEMVAAKLRKRTGIECRVFI